MNHIVNIQNILKLWKLRNAAIEGRIVVFKSLAILKLIHLALFTKIPTSTINLLTNIQMEFIWTRKNPAIKNSTLRNYYKSTGLKNVDVFSKVVRLQYSWIKRLFDSNFHQWKWIPLYLIRQYLGKNFKFHSNLEVSHSILYKFPKFHKEKYSLDWVNTFLHRLLCRQQWHVSLFGITSIYLYNFSNRNLNFVGQLFDTDGKLKSWECKKRQFLLKNNMQFHYRQKNTCSTTALERNYKTFCRKSE